MTIVASRLVTPSLSHSLPLAGTVSSRPSAFGRTKTHRLLSLVADGGIMVAAVWSLPFVIIAMGTPIALAILGVLQLLRLLQNAF
jgi:hypothetical protein